MRAVLILSVFIAAAVACPLLTKKDCSCGSLPKICPSSWKIKTFKSQWATLAFQGVWNVQMTTPTYIDEQNPLKTGMFCSCYPCAHNQLIFRDTTPCDKTDFNTEYEMIDSSYNIYTRTTETQKSLLSPAYGKSSSYAIFNVGCERYYENPITEQYPFIDDNLIRHKIGQNSCEREYTFAVIGADKAWKEYMVIVLINKYKNYFSGNEYIIWAVTRELNPKWSTYNKIYEDIKASCLSPNYLVSVDHSILPTDVPSLGVPSLGVPSLGVPSLGVPSIATDDINSLVEKTSVSTKTATKSITSDYDSSTSTSTTCSKTTTTSTVIIQKSSDFSSLYQYGTCDLYKPYNGLSILKGMDNKAIRNALRGRYYMQHGTPCSFYDSPNSRPGILNNGFPSCSMELYFEDITTDQWDYNTHYMVMDRGYNMRTGKVEQTRSYISSAYSEDHPFGSTVFSMYCEGYYDEEIEELNRLTIDGMICKRPSDIYKQQIILSIIGYKEDDYIMFCAANQYKNPFLTKPDVPLVFCYTRNRIPSQDTMNCITQELLRCGVNPNHLIKIDHTIPIENEFTFDKSYYESKITRSISSTRGLTLGDNAPLCASLPSICPKEWKVKRFKSQCATIAFQKTWNLQMTTPTYINGNNPLKTGLFCNCYPCAHNQLIFKDTTPCDDTDYNIEYEMIDSSYNLYTQTTEIQRSLLSPAYGKCSSYAIFNVGCERYYENPITEQYPFIDDNLIRHKIGQNSCEREYTFAVIGADEDWSEYMVIVIMNQYKNYFSGNKYIIWVVTRELYPHYSTYKKAYEDIERSCLSPYYLVSVDHSITPTGVPSLGVPSLGVPSLGVPSLGVPSIATGDINSVVEKTSVSTKTATKSITSDYDSSTSSSTTCSKTTTTSTVIIQKSSDFSSVYQVARCDLYNGDIQILQGLDNKAIRNALHGRYYMQHGTPCSFYDSPDARPGLLHTSFPASSLQLCFDDVSMDKWDYHTHHMVMDRGYNMRTGEFQETRSYITSAYPEDHPFGSTVFSMYCEGYYDKEIEEINRLTIDGMICKQPSSDIYKHQIILSIIGYKEDDYIIFCAANQYKNPFFCDEQVYQVYTYTRSRIPSQTTLDCITQELLRCGVNPNHLIKIDQCQTLEDDYVFDASYYESQTSCWSSSSSSSSSMSSTSYSSSSSSSSITISSD